MITLQQLQEVNSDRARRWHTNEEEPWTLVDWTNALAGEAGEACNKSKKLKRILTHLPNKEAGLDKSNESDLKMGVALECGDTILYAILTINHLGYNVEDIVRHVFNKKSEEYGFPERV